MRIVSDQDLVSIAIDLAKQAAEKINQIRQQDFAVHIKNDQSPVTEADQQAEAIILSGLRKFVPDIPIIAEEEMAAHKQVRTGSEYWLVDPLDGTRGFIRNSRNFTVNIGLIRDQKPVLGVVACPAFHQIFYGIVGKGAWKIDKNGIVPIHVTPPPKAGFRVLVSSSHDSNPKLHKFLEFFPVSSLNHVGSAIKTLHIAEGTADLHPRFKPTMEWDTAAPQAILEAAGGFLRTFDNQPLRYGKPDWKNPDFFCSGVPIDAFLKQFHP